MKKSLKISLGALALGVACVSLWAYSIDYITMQGNYSPNTAVISGQGHVATITSQICPGDPIPFSVAYSVTGQQGNTSFPQTVTFNVLNDAGNPESVGFTGFPTTHVFTGQGSTFTDSGSLTAPNTLGSYTVNVRPTGGTGGNQGIAAGSGLTINFTVSECTPVCNDVHTVLTLPEKICVLLHQTTPVDLTATLTDDSSNPIANQTVHFSVDGNDAGDAVTNGSGVATISNYDVSGLSVGNHQVKADFDGTDCFNGTKYLSTTNGGGILGVSYLFLGFQQPINADGTSKFQGGTIPVKIKIADANGAPITDAAAHVFFGQLTPTVISNEAEAVANTNGDSGNLMRYDPLAGQYIFNWDTRPVDNGQYDVWVDLGEGACGDTHSVTLSINKVGKGNKK